MILARLPAGNLGQFFSAWAAPFQDGAERSPNALVGGLLALRGGGSPWPPLRIVTVGVQERTLGPAAEERLAALAWDRDAVRQYTGLSRSQSFRHKAYVFPS